MLKLNSSARSSAERVSPSVFPRESNGGGIHRQINRRFDSPGRYRSRFWLATVHAGHQSTNVAICSNGLRASPLLFRLFFSFPRAVVSCIGRRASEHRNKCSLARCSLLSEGEIASIKNFGRTQAMISVFLREGAIFSSDSFRMNPFHREQARRRRVADDGIGGRIYNSVSIR